MKSLKITGDRRTGKTSILADSIVTHVTDPDIKSDVRILVTASTLQERKYLQGQVARQINSLGVLFRSVMPMSSGNGSIQIGEKMITFVVPDMKYFIGRDIDYIFIENSDLIDVGFMDFINMIMKPFVIVVETHNTHPFPKVGNRKSD